MESATPKAAKSSLNVFLRLSDLCKINGSLPINPQPFNSKDIKTEKIHLSSSEEEETVLLKLLDSISSVKLAYVQLQQAYLQYDPKKIKNSDKFLISQFDSLSKLEVLYNEKQSENPKSLKIQEHEKLLVVLKSIVEEKESETERLRFEFEQLERENSDLEEKVQKKKKPLIERRLNLTNRELTPNLFCEVFKLASRSVHDFSKPLISFMRVSGWNMDLVINSMYKNVKFHEKSHKKYVFEAYISKVMFARCHNEYFSMDKFDLIMGFEDPFETLILDPHSDFGLFCREKYLELIPSKMEDSFFGNLDHREFVTAGGHPRTPFYEAFIKMARWIWALRVMKRTFIPKGEMFYVKEGDLCDKCYMESVVSEMEGEIREGFRVGFTVLPGFKIGETVVRSRVYLSKSFEKFEG